MQARSQLVAIAYLIAGLLLLQYALVQCIFSVMTMTETTGTIVKIEEVSNQDTLQYRLGVNFQTSEGLPIYVEGMTTRLGELRIGYIVDVVYFPWNPQDARIGRSRIGIVAFPFQLLLMLVAAIAGCVLLWRCYVRLPPDERFAIKSRNEALVLLALCVFAIIAAVWLWHYGRPGLI